MKLPRRLPTIVILTVIAHEVPPLFGAALSVVIEPTFVVDADRVGRAVTAADEFLFVGAQLNYVHTTGEQYVGRVAVFHAVETGYEQVATLEPPADIEGLHGAAFDEFGRAISVRNGIAVIGAPSIVGFFGPVYADRPGKAYVYQHDGSKWLFVQELSAPDGHDGDGFGWSVATNGHFVAIGAPMRSFAGTEYGKVYVYAPREDTGGTYDLQQTIDAPITETRWFGAALDFDRGGITLAIGAPGEAVVDEYNGAVYLFRLDPHDETWAVAGKVFGGPTSNAVSTGFGSAVDLDSQRLAVGAGGDSFWEPNGPHSRGAGSVSVFLEQDGVWTLEQKIVPLQPITAGSVGSAVSLRDDALMIGAPGGDQDFPLPQGAAYVYRFTGFQWDFAERLYADPDGPSAFAHFGRAVHVDSAIAFVGDPGLESPFSADQGVVFQAMVRWPGDSNLDGDTDRPDYAAFADCFAGPCDKCELAGECECYDFDLDGDVDLNDVAVRQRAATSAN